MRVTLDPEIDLEPSPVDVPGNFISTLDPTEYRFWIRNRGGMDAPSSRWRLVGEGVLLAEGDTLVDGRDSVEVIRVLPPTLPKGSARLRVVVDTLGAVLETNESNNAWTRTVMVADAPVPPVPDRLALSPARPNPTAAEVHLSLGLPSTSVVSWSVHDLLGREVWSVPAKSYDGGVWDLRWDGRGESGRRVKPGLYFFRVKVAGRTFVRRIALM